MSIQESAIAPQNKHAENTPNHIADDNIEYIGRNDFHITICGHRIELVNLEKTLLNYPHIKQVCVLSKNRTDNPSRGLLSADNGTPKYLVVYYVASQDINSDKFMAYLSLCLPDYMVPKHFVRMADFPLTNNGKVDHHALQVFLDLSKVC